MMAEKENGIIEGATFPSIWELNPQTGSAIKLRDIDVDQMGSMTNVQDIGTVIGLLDIWKVLLVWRVVAFLLM